MVSSWRNEMKQILYQNALFLLIPFTFSIINPFWRFTFSLLFVSEEPNSEMQFQFNIKSYEGLEKGKTNFWEKLCRFINYIFFLSLTLMLISPQSNEAFLFYGLQTLILILTWVPVTIVPFYLFFWLGLSVYYGMVFQSFLSSASFPSNFPKATISCHSIPVPFPVPFSLTWSRNKYDHLMPPFHETICGHDQIQEEPKQTWMKTRKPCLFLLTFQSGRYNNICLLLDKTGWYPFPFLSPS